MKLTCYALHDHAPKLVAARPQRNWMDEFPDRHAYRCLPLAIANAHGWEVLCPVPIEITWNGGPAIADIQVRALAPLPEGRPVEHFCRSNFSRGIVTFHLDYIFRTEPGWNLLATGPLNQPKDNASPLTGIIEADWLPYPFTMNWQLMRPGRVVFEQDEPFCFVFPIAKHTLQDVQPEIRRLSDDPEISRQHDAFRASRDEFMERFRAGDEATIRQAWQRLYFLGQHPDGTRADGHINKLRLNEPIDRRVSTLLTPKSDAAMNGAGLAPDHVRLHDPAICDADSALSDIHVEQTQRNIEGRARLDGEGRLIDWSNTYVVRSQEDGADCDLLVAENLLEAEQCEALCRAFHKLADRTFKSDRMDPYWNDRFIWLADVMAAEPSAGQIMIDTAVKAAQRVQEFYRLKVPVYSDLSQIVQWRPGAFMPPHADNANPDGSTHAMAHRAFSGIVYLNDDYEGGELYFTALDIAIKPKRGMFVAFTAGFHHEHAVLRVQSGSTRLTLPMFFTFDHAMADRTLRGAQDISKRQRSLTR